MITFTDDRGEYMLYFNKIKIEEDILEQEVDESGHIKRRFINMDGTIKFIMLIDCPGIPRFEREYEKGAEEGKTTLVNILLVEGS